MCARVSVSVTLSLYVCFRLTKYYMCLGRYKCVGKERQSWRVREREREAERDKTRERARERGRAGESEILILCIVDG